jgi:hypothetical protein
MLPHVYSIKSFFMRSTDKMTDAELLDYCERHAQTNRPYFSKKVVQRVIALAGEPEDYATLADLRVMQQSRFLMTDDMRELCRLARVNKIPCSHAVASAKTSAHHAPDFEYRKKNELSLLLCQYS